MSDIKIGDVVKLKNKDTKMTASALLPNDKVFCIWMNERGVLMTEEIANQKLEKVLPLESTGLFGDETPDNIK